MFPGDTIRLQLGIAERAGLLYADQLLLITAAVQQLREAGCLLRIRMDTQGAGLNTGAVRYASRVDFFRLLQIQDQIPEKFVRRPGHDRFCEITAYNRDNYIEAGRRIVQIVIAHVQVAARVQVMLDFCLFELLDNVLIHSAYPEPFGGKGWCTAQYFPAAREIRLGIADTGIGIHRALTGPAGSKYRAFSAYQAIRHCVEKGVSNGEGLGFGLYATLEFIRRNGGELLIYSGACYATYKAGRFTVKYGAYWQGTVVYLRIRTDAAADYSGFMPGNYPLAADYAYFHGDRVE